MKINLSLILLLVGLFCSSSMLGQSSFVLKFKIWKKTPTGDVYLGSYVRNTTGNQNFGNSFPTAISAALCPGDQLVLENLCQKQTNGVFTNHDFRGSGHSVHDELTIGLTNQNRCSNPVPPTNFVDVLHAAAVGNFYVPPASQSNYQAWTYWKYGTKKTITIAPEAPITTTGNVYLVISAGRFGHVVNNCGCGNRYYFIALNVQEGVDPIADQEICEGDVVSFSLNPNYTYSNWSPNNPNGTSPSATTDYTVDVVNNNTGCTLTDEFQVVVHQPAVPLISQTVICYDNIVQLPALTDDDLASFITVNGELIYDFWEGLNHLPFNLSGYIQGAGTIDIEYIYFIDENRQETCTKTYQVTIDDPIDLTVQNSYAYCVNNFQPICANPTAQVGISYNWSFGGNPIATTNCFTPTAHGTYSLYAYRLSTGCGVARTVEVTNPGVGIAHPGNISFCSLTGEQPPSTVGWDSDPFSATTIYSFSWTYQDLGGTSTSLTNTGAQYQVPYMGQGTYTVDIMIGNGCTETFVITVLDQYQEFNNHPNAQFSTTQLSNPPGAIKFGHYAMSSVAGGVESWVVRDATGAIVPHWADPSGFGINYFSNTGEPLWVTLSIIVEEQCTVYRWSNRPSGRIHQGTDNPTIATTKELAVQAFPNPTTGILTLKVMDAEEPTTIIRVMNSVGQVVLEQEEQNATEVQLDLARLTAGLYQVQVVNGSAKVVETVVKQ